MSKKSGRERKQNRRKPGLRRYAWLWLAGGGAVVLLIGALVTRESWSGRESQVTPQVAGAPRLSIDRTTVDEGYIKYNVPIRTTFRLGNVGDQPLKILSQPQVRLVEGC